MIQTISAGSFKSLEDVQVELGALNVFVGANGSGKSNLLEAVGVLSAASDGKVNDQTLLQRGVRPGVPKLYKSAFPSSSSTHIRLEATSAEASYGVSLNNPLNDPAPAWRFKTEHLESGTTKVVGRSPNSRENPNTENGLAALKMVELAPADPASLLMRRLQGYVIFSPTTAVMRGVSRDDQPRDPMGLSGGRLAEAVAELRARKDDRIREVVETVVELVDWIETFDSAASDSIPLSPAARGSSRVIKFKDRFMKKDRNVLSGYDASEGALYVLFLAVLAAHPRAPLFFAVDSADHGLNPGLATALIRAFSRWIVENPRQPQLLVTSHNPAVLDGLPLRDDRVRLFTVDRDDGGRTVVRRVVISSELLKMAKDRDWPLSRLWMNNLIGGMPRSFSERDASTRGCLSPKVALLSRAEAIPVRWVEDGRALGSCCFNPPGVAAGS